MLRAISRALAVTAVLLCVGAPIRADQHEGRRDFTWSRAYVLTPIEHKRLRAMGLSDREVFVAAQTAHLAGRQHVDDIVQMILRGETAHSLAYRHGLAVSWITERRPEWETEAWRQAVERGDMWWIPASATLTSPPPPGATPGRR